MSKDTASQPQAVPSELASLKRYNLSSDHGGWVAEHPEGQLVLFAEVQSLFSHSAATGKARPTDDELWDETIRNRDTYHDWADKLAEAISKHFGIYIGEHSNTNCPWVEALEAIESKPSKAVSKAWDRFEQAVYNTAASPAAPLAGKAEPTAIYQAWDALDGGWMDTDKDGYDRVPEDGRRIVYTAPLAAAVPAEEASDELMRKFAEVGLSPAEPAPIQSSALTDERIVELVTEYRMGYNEYDQDPVGYCKRFARAIEAEVLACLSKPTAQGAAESASIDGPEFRKLAWEFHDIPNGSGFQNTAFDALIAHINRHIAAQATAGRDAQQWISVDERLPDGECLAIYVTESGKQRLIRAKYARQFQIEAEGDEDYCETEYNDDDDTFYIKAGWLECIDNWGEYSSCYVTEGTVTHWMLLPAAPHAAEQASGGANADAAR